MDEVLGIEDMPSFKLLCQRLVKQWYGNGNDDGWDD